MATKAVYLIARLTIQEKACGAIMMRRWSWCADQGILLHVSNFGNFSELKVLSEDFLSYVG